MRTYTPKPGDITRAWHVIDAQDIVLGRLASQAATLLRGRLVWDGTDVLGRPGDGVFLKRGM